MRLFAATLAFASSCLMLGLMVHGQGDRPIHYVHAFDSRLDFAALFVILTGLVFFACLVASFLPKQLREHYGQRVTAWLSPRGESDDDDDEELSR